jgi:hypothetical protein
MEWIECDDYEKLPNGEWLVKIDDDEFPHVIAYVTDKTGDGHKMIIVNGHFSMDMGQLIAYTSFEPYEPPNQQGVTR